MREHKHLNPLVPLCCVLVLPALACLAILFVEPGINRSLFYAAVKTGIVLIAVGGAMSFVASWLAARSEH